MKTPMTTTLPRPSFSDHRPLLDALRAREKVETLVEDCAADLDTVVPGLRLRRAFAGGAWVVGLVKGGLPDGGEPFSRLEFQIQVGDQGRRLSLRALRTVRNRDAGADELSVDADAQGYRQARAFIEEACCRFVDRWFEREGY